MRNTALLTVAIFLACSASAHAQDASLALQDAFAHEERFGESSLLQQHIDAVPETRGAERDAAKPAEAASEHPAAEAGDNGEGDQWGDQHKEAAHSEQR